MPGRRRCAHGPVFRTGLARAALVRAALVHDVFRTRRAGRPWVAIAALAVALTGCGTLTETPQQYVMVQTVLDHQQVAGIGCVLSNDVGRWFVTSPGRVQIRKSTKPLVVDCRLNDVWAYDQIDPKQNASRWGNILLTAGAGQFVDRQTGAGFDYPQVLTVLLQRGTPNVPAQGTTAQPAQPSPPPSGGGSPIY